MKTIKVLMVTITCVTYMALLSSCEEKIDNPNNPGVVDNPVVDTLSGKIYTETISDINFSMDMVYVQGGTFDMGATAEQGDEAVKNEKPVHKVTLTSYHISKYEITQAQWNAVMGVWPYESEREIPSKYKGDSLPIIYVSWFEAVEFCVKLSNKTGKKYALPTEAQWEFAARGGTKSKGYKYSGSNAFNDVAWCGGCLISDGGTTHAVGTKAPNELGIYDMSGNVIEWCADWYGSYSSDAVTNPAGPNSGSGRVFRGGSYYDESMSCRVSSRSDNEPVNQYIPGAISPIGFRVVCLP